MLSRLTLAVATIVALLSGCEADAPEPDPVPEPPVARPDSAPMARRDTVRIFFSNSRLDPQALDCAAVYPVRRAVDDATPIAALDELLEGPTEAEKERGFLSSLPPDARIASVERDGGTVRADFAELPGAGSCMVTAIRAQIESTLIALPEVERAVITVRGSRDAALQP